MFFLFSRYLNAIQTMCPHILRYLTTAVITHKRRKQVVKDLVKVIQQVHYNCINSVKKVYNGALYKQVCC